MLLVSSFSGSVVFCRYLGPTTRRRRVETARFNLTPSSMKTLFNFLLPVFLAVAVVGCDGNDNSKDDDAPSLNIVETAVSAGTFDTLVAAVTAADLVSVLEGPGPFTVFAPTEAAFAALPAGTVDTLLMPENKDQLIAVLTYHVVSGAVTSEQVVGLTSAPTVQGSSVNIRVEGGVVYINDAAVTQVDIEASNGVIHVIDQVLLPPAN